MKKSPFSGWIYLNQKSRYKFFPYFLFQLSVYIFVFGSCSLSPEFSNWFGEEKSFLKDIPSTRIYWNVSPGSQSSESFRALPGHLRYLVIQTLPNKEKIWQGEVDLWETKEEFQGSLPKGMYFPKLSFKASLFTGPAKVEELVSGVPKKISFLPSAHSFWEWEGDSHVSGNQNIPSKISTISNWAILFDLLPEGIVWISKEKRLIANDYQLGWENIPNRRTSLSTDFTHPSGVSFPYADYDYRNQIFRSLSNSEEALPIWIYRKEGDVRWAWGLLPEDLLVSSSFSKRKQAGKMGLANVLFYDATNNNPFTARADLKNYPIILIKDEDNARK